MKLGLNNFMGNIDKHLETGFITWLTGSVAQAGITLPDNWDLPGIFQLVMQLLGLGFDQLIAKMSQMFGFDLMSVIEPVKQVIAIYQEQGLVGLARMGLERLIGQEQVEALVEVWGLIQKVISGDWNALWEIVQEQLSNLKTMVFDQITEYISEKVIKGGITWLISLFNPVGAFIKACKAIYDIIMFFVNNGKQIMALVDAVINSVTAIASGNIGVAATAIENALAKGLPVAIGFLASLLNLGDIGKKVQEIIQSVRGLVDKAINAIFNLPPVKMVVGFIKKVIGKIGNLINRGGQNKAPDAVPSNGADNRPTDDKLKNHEQAFSAVETVVKEGQKKGIEPDELNKQLMPLKAQYGFKKLLIHKEGNSFEVDAEINPVKVWRYGGIVKMKIIYDPAWPYDEFMSKALAIKKAATLGELMTLPIDPQTGRQTTTDTIRDPRKTKEYRERVREFIITRVIDQSKQSYLLSLLQQLQVDHQVELQLSGKDRPGNFALIEGAMNGAFGWQEFRPALRQLEPGTVIEEVIIDTSALDKQKQNKKKVRTSGIASELRAGLLSYVVNGGESNMIRSWFKLEDDL